MTDIERSEKLCYLSAALAQCTPWSGDSALVCELLEQAGLPSPKSYVYDGASVAESVRTIIREAKRIGLLS